MSDRGPADAGDVAVCDRNVFDIAPGRLVPPVTLGYALDRYVAAVQRKPLSPAYKRRIGESIEAFQHYVADREAGEILRHDPTALRVYLADPFASERYRRDVPLNEIDRLWLEAVCDHIHSRPLSRKVDRATGKRKPIDPYTVKTVLQHAWQAFDWIDSASDADTFGGWELPKKAERLFIVGVAKLMTKPERDRHSDGPDQIAFPELVALYHAIDPANTLHKIILLMGIFTAQGQSELSHAMRCEFDLKRARFVHRRNKTGQQGEYWLPPELVQLLKGYFAWVPTDRDDTAFFTAGGNRLVSETSDAVRQAFDDWRIRAKINRTGIGFYACRRLLGDLAKRAGGKELRAAALAHAGSDVGDRHYSNHRDFGRLQRVARKLYQNLRAAGMFATSVEGRAERKKVWRESARTN
jgi:integrase